MLLKNAKVYTPDRKFEILDVAFDERITAVGKLPQAGEDLRGGFLIPGMIDIHTHGAMGSDTCDATPESLRTMARYYIRRGITSFCAASMTYDEGTLTRVMENAAAFEDAQGARLLGINMEGPFIAPAKKGAQNGAYITPPDWEMFTRLQKAAQGRIRLVDIAPEVPGALPFISRAAGECAVSVAHTAANFDQAQRAFEAGADHATHLFNAMNPFLHRDPGPIGAALDAGAYVELICDGLHIHPAVIRAVFKMFGPERVCVISDSMRSAGLPDGDYELGGQKVFVREGKATLADGTIAASNSNLLEELQNCIRFGVPAEEAVAAVTCNPARSIRMEADYGAIAPGKYADLCLLDENWNLKAVWRGGKRVI